MFIRGIFFFALTSLITLPTWANESAIPNTPAKKLFLRLTGTPLSSRDSRHAKMMALIDKGDDFEAAKIAMDDDNFYRITVRHWASLMSNREGTPYVALDDFQSLVIGVVRDGLDARLLLTGDFTYKQSPLLGNGGTFDFLLFDQRGASYKKDLFRIPQPPLATDLEPAGLLTTQAWAKAHYSGGTNRRAVQYAFQEFLCAPIDKWKTPNLDDRFVRRDVDRAPGDNPRTYQIQCRSCHAPMDAMAGAFSRLNFDQMGNQGRFLALPTVHPKYNQNTQVYPEGNATFDDAWTNPLAENHIQDEFFGWEGPTQGEGVKAFGQMLANSGAFKSCLVKKVFTSLCKREPVSRDGNAIQSVAQTFSENGYDLKRVFGGVALLPACVGGIE